MFTFWVTDSLLILVTVLQYRVYQVCIIDLQAYYILLYVIFFLLFQEKKVKKEERAHRRTMSTESDPPSIKRCKVGPSMQSSSAPDRSRSKKKKFTASSVSHIEQPHPKSLYAKPTTVEGMMQEMQNFMEVMKSRLTANISAPNVKPKTSTVKSRISVPEVESKLPSTVPATDGKFKIPLISTSEDGYLQEVEGESDYQSSSEARSSSSDHEKSPKLRIPTYTTDNEDDIQDTPINVVQEIPLPEGAPKDITPDKPQIVDTFKTEDDSYVGIEINASGDEFSDQMSEAEFSTTEEINSSEDERRNSVKDDVDAKQNWRDSIMDIASRSGFSLPEMPQQPMMAGDSPQRRRQLFQLPPSALQNNLLASTAAQLSKDMEAKAGAKKTYHTVFPRYPRFNSKFLYANEKWEHKEKVCRPQLNSNFSDLLSDDPKKAGKPTGHCALNAKDTRLLESAAGWQRRHLSYMEYFLGNTRRIIKETQEIEGLPIKVSDNLSSALNSVNQAAILLKDQILPTHLYIDTRLQLGRRDTEIARLHNYIPQERICELRASRFATLLSEPLFDSSVLKAAKEDIEYRRKDPTGYIAHTLKGSNYPRQRLDTASRPYNNKRRRQNHNQQNKQQPTQQQQGASRGRGGKKRGRGSNRGAQK